MRTAKDVQIILSMAILAMFFFLQVPIISSITENGILKGNDGDSYAHCWSKPSLRSSAYRSNDLNGGSWFDNFTDESRIEWKKNVNVQNRNVNLSTVEINEWYEIYPSTHPTARTCPSSTIFKTNKILIFGGRNPVGERTDETWVFDYNTKEWTNMNPQGNKPSARETHAMAPIWGDDKVVVFGGWDVARLGDTWVYDLSENTWTNKNTGISNRNSHAMATIYGDDKIVLFGGWGAGDETFVYDLGDNQWTRKYPNNHPTSEHGHAMASIYNDDKVVLFGGSEEGANTWVYDLSDNEWTNKNPTNYPSAGYTEHELATIYNDDKVIYFCAWDTWIYDLSDNQWYNKNPPSSPSGRSWMNLAMVDGNNEIVLFGGAGELNDTWIYDVRNFLSSGFLVSNPIQMPLSMHWDTLIINKTEAPNHFINVSITDTATNIIIPGFDNITANGTIDVSSIDFRRHSVIRLNASFQGNGSNTPILHSWGIKWTNHKPSLGKPTGIIPINRTETINISILATDYEEFMSNLIFTVQYKHNLSEVWKEAYLFNIHSNSTHYFMDFIPPSTAPIGSYDLRFKLDDSLGLTTGWRYYYNTIEVNNNKPSFDGVLLSALEVFRNDRIQITALNLSDVENETSSLTLSVYHRLNSTAILDNTWISERALMDDDVLCTFSPPVHAPLGLDDVIISICDGDDDVKYRYPSIIDVKNNLPVLSAELGILSMWANTTKEFSLLPYGSDVEDELADLLWTYNASSVDDSNIEVISIENSLLTITPVQGVSGSIDIELILSDSDDGSVSKLVTLNIIHPDQKLAAILECPENGAIQNTTTVNLSWSTITTNSEALVNYDIYLSTILNEVLSHSPNCCRETTTNEYFMASNLDDRTVYYWSVIPKNETAEGICVPIFFTFTMSLTGDPPIIEEYSITLGPIIDDNHIPVTDVWVNFSYNNNKDRF